MLFFKAEVDIQYRLHKFASCLPADSAEINTNMKYKHVSNYATKHKKEIIELITPQI